MAADASPGTALRVTHTSAVTPDQIDHLGHMNVRFYAVNALAATHAVLADLPGWDGRPHQVHDVYTRHHREQLEGTPLEVRSAVLGADPGGLRLHHELVAADSGVLAATFVHGISPVAEDGARLPVPDDVIRAAQAEAIDAPGYAAPRTVSLDADLAGSAPSLDELLERGLAMRQPRHVSSDECDERGRYRVDLAPLLTWAGVPIGGETGGEARETADGKLMAWASMETRVQLCRLPPVGTRIQSFGAPVAVHDKVTHRVHWAYDLDRGDLLTAFEAVSMAFDIRGRRPMPLPDNVRAWELQRIQPDLAPRPLV
jgi:acyl-CoA thioesterase FadM